MRLDKGIERARSRHELARIIMGTIFLVKHYWDASKARETLSVQNQNLCTYTYTYVYVYTYVKTIAHAWNKNMICTLKENQNERASVNSQIDVLKKM